MPPANLSYFDVAKTTQAAHSPTAVAATGQTVVTGYQFGPFSFGASSPIGQILGNLAGDSQAVADANAAFAKANPDATIGDTLAQYGSVVGGIAGSAIGYEAQGAGSLFGQTARSAGSGVGSGAGSLVAGVGSGVNLGATAAAPGVAAGINQGVQGAITGAGSVLSGVTGGLGASLSSGTGGKLAIYLGLGLAAILLILFLLK